MAIKITASVTVRKRDLRKEALNPDTDGGRQFAAYRVSEILRDVLRGVTSSTSFVDGLIVTVQEVNKNGEPKGIAAQEPSRELRNV